VSDRAFPGHANFAVFSLLARLGLRAVEVSRLQFADLHWRAGEIKVDGKAHRRDRLPLAFATAQAYGSPRVVGQFGGF
jgi:integrase/recombinase XerD